MGEPLWEVGAKAIADHRDDKGGGWEHPDDIWRIYTPFAKWVIAAVEPLIRADERERIARAIEAVAAPYRKQPYPNLEQSIAYRNAIRIARSGGRDE